MILQKSDSNYVKLSKEEILVEEGTVLFIIPTQVASTHLAAYHIRKLKEKGVGYLISCDGRIKSSSIFSFVLERVSCALSVYERRRSLET